MTGMASLPCAGDVTALDLIIVAAPIAEDPTIGHAHVEIRPVGEVRRKLPKGTIRELARLAGQH
jgi:hypothetical protein